MTPDELRARRLALGWSKQKLASAVGVPAAVVAKWEAGELPIDCPSAVELTFRNIEGQSGAKLLRKSRKGVS